MCCLFGCFNYSGKEIFGIDELVNSLAQEATVRGTDATGIAYNKDGRLIVYKKPKSAYYMTFKGLNGVRCVTGHTRHATQGAVEVNKNNHPFLGYTERNKFALAHNGVLLNDTTLQRQYTLPYTSIKTDSYVAVQLLEHFADLNFQTIQKMSEALLGSFCFSILDNTDTLYLVKGDNPLHIVHFPRYGLYVYASTESILYKALIDTIFFDEVKAGLCEDIKICAGDIVRIVPNGKIDTQRFTQKQYTYGTADWRSTAYRYGWWDDEYEADAYEASAAVDTGNGKVLTLTDVDYNKEYIADLRHIACFQGYEPEDVDEWIRSGMTLDEIEDYLYNPDDYC